MTQTYLKERLSQKFNFDEWKELLNEIFPKVELFTKEKGLEVEKTQIKNGGHIGNIRLDDGRSLAIFCFEVNDNVIISRNRKSLRDISIKYVDQSLIHGTLAFYYSQNQDDYRLTFIAKQTSFDENGNLITTETTPKRYTFLLGANEPCSTAANRLMELANKKKNGSMSLTDVIEAFSVERLNKEFFNGYKAQYTKFLKTIADTKQHRDYVKKLLGRLVFLQFLQKKGWMGAPATNDKWEGGDKNYLRTLMDKYKGNNRILSDVLEPLFFKTLNEKRPGDIADSRLGDNIKIPYLNGGLFDKDRIDELDIDFEYSYFDELINFFSQYNFTIDENDPDDTEVGIDPEMLGHIFENLLEDNKDKGAFYTPKEIVQYMCNESVVQYLKTHTDAQLHAALENLIRNRQVDAELQNKETANAIYELLRAVKVCDPAIGSGAFPMGVLNVLFNTRQILYGFRRDMKPFLPEEVKRDIIQNNIYGVDIEKGAVDIARLRFWLSIVVDEESPSPLPNLDYKIMQGNSLLESFMGVDLSQILAVNKDGSINKNALKQSGKKNIQYSLLYGEEKNAINEIQLMVRTYFNITDHEEKKRIRETIDLRIKDYIQFMCTKPECIEAIKNIDDNNKPFFLWHLYFAEVFQEGGFDIVIGNPPYIQLQNNGGELALLYEKCGFKTFTKTGDIYSLFYEKGWQLLKPKGNLCFITSNKWMRAAYGEKTREFFSKNTDPKILIDFSGVDVFESATVVTNIILFTRESNNGKTFCTVTSNRSKNCINNIYSFISQNMYIQNLASSDDWIMLKPEEYCIKKKIIDRGIPLKDWDIEIYRGILTGFNDAFIINTEKRNSILDNCSTEEERTKTAELIRPILRGKDLKRYDYDWANLWLINTHNGIKGIKPPIDINEYPSLKTHLDSYWNKIFNRTDKGDTPYNLRNCAYLDNFDKPKLIYPETTKGARFAYDTSGIYIDKTCFMLISDDALYLQKILSSKLFEVAYNKMFSSTELVNHTFQYNKHTLIKLPVVKDSNIIKELSSIENERDIDMFIYRLYDLTYDEILVVDPETTISREEYEKESVK